MILMDHTNYKGLNIKGFIIAVFNEFTINEISLNAINCVILMIYYGLSFPFIKKLHFPL